MAIVVAVDRSGRSAHVVSRAISLAATFDEAVYVVHALTCLEFTDPGLTSTQAEEPKDMDEIRSAAAEMAEDFVSGLDVLYEMMGLVDNPADKIIEYADGQGASYIVTSSQCRSQTGRMLFGSVTQSILLNVSCPIVSTLVNEE